jgi:hypothetical protein
MTPCWLTIAIPTMDRWSFLKESLPELLDRPEVVEVIVCDENGNDAKQIAQSPLAHHPRLRVVVNPRVLGIYENKRKCLELVKYSDWVALLDSDNFFREEFFDVLSDVIDLSDHTIIYASAEAKHVNYKDNSVKVYTEEFVGLNLTAKVWNSVLEMPRWNFLLNEGNWVVPVDVLKTLPSSVKSSDLLAADAIYMLKCFVAGGFTVRYVPGLTYLHIVHDESTWLKTDRESTRILNGTNWRL